MSNIKINDVPQRIQYSATGGQTQFTIPFPFFANSYVYVWLNGIQIFQGGAPGQYVVTGAGSPSGGLVTFNTAATLNDIVTIEGIMPIDRTSIYSATISNLTGSDLNGDFNREVVMLQQLNTTQSFMQLQYAPWTEISQDLTVTTDRYIPLLPALAAWRMNAAGTEIETFQTPSSGGLAPDDATYLLQVANSDLPNAQAMGSLTSGLVVNTATTGVQLTRVLAGTANQLAIANASGIAGNPTVSITPNPTIPGTEYILLPSGTTAQRPVTPTDGMVRYNTDTQSLEVYEGSSWDALAGGIVDSVLGTANQINVDNTDPQNPVLSLSSTLVLPGTMEAGGNVNMDSHLINNLLDPVSNQDAATKAYVDAITAGFIFINPVLVASTGNLVATYDNGVSGVGATLTVTALGVASIDGVALSLNERVLFKNQSNTFENGIYYVSNVGSGGTSAVYTRATDFDQPSEIDPGDLVPVLAGSTQAGTLWLQTATVTAVGTDPITFIQFAVSFSNVVTIDGIQTITGAKTFNANVVLGNNATLQLNSTVAIDEILDEDNMVSDSNTAVPTQQSVKAYVDASAGRLKSFQIFTSGTAQTYTRPAGITSILVEVLGGGGGGGSAVASGAGTCGAAGGGGAGGYARLWVPSASSSYTYTVGGGGNGGSAAAANAGATGGTTTFSASSLQATGGVGGNGQTGSAAAGFLGSGAGGVGSNGDFNANGMPGLYAIQLASGAAGLSGAGGSGIYGGGAIPTGIGAVGNNATNYGSGGSGGAAGTATNRAGGNGSAGIIIVWEFS